MKKYSQSMKLPLRHRKAFLDDCGMAFLDKLLVAINCEDYGKKIFFVFYKINFII